MRSLRLLLVLAFPLTLAQAQDAASMAAQQAAAANQQAIMNAQMATQQAQEQAQMASQQAAQNAQNAQNATSLDSHFAVARPKFSVKPGSYPSAITVKMTDSTRGAVIYYTTDGWTPTANSTRYTGPVTISSTTQLQAIALVPQLPVYRSRIASAVYSLPGSKPTAQASTVAAIRTADGKLLIPKGTTVPLVFASPVSSRTAEVGDKLALALADDFKVGDVVVAKKGTPVSAVVTEAYKSASLGRPGEVAFQVQEMTTDGTVIMLAGSATLEGRDKAQTAMALATIPPGIGAFMQHGQEAEIQTGTPFLASVKADTALPATLQQ